MKSCLHVQIFKTMCFALCILLLMCCFSGCKIPKQEEPYRNEEREVGDFIVWFYDDYCEIAGTTEQGNNKRFLVVPEFIESFRVTSFGYNGALDYTYPGSLTRPNIESDVLEKIYFECAIEVYPSLRSYDCPNLQKIMYPAVEDGRGISGDVYYPRSVYECALHIDEALYRAVKFPANVSYYYNCENAKNNGYYFIDDYEYGGKIEFIPNDPIREGYTFGGWYKEKECLNKWDFETDTLPEELTEQKEIHKDGDLVLADVTVYQETILYAKWIEQV